MKKTSINLRERTQEQIDDLIRNSGNPSATTMTGIIQGAVDEMHRQHVRDDVEWRPTYTEYYVEAEEGEQGAFPVKGINPEGPAYDSYLREATLEEALQANAGVFYVQVKHSLEYPYAKYDFEDAPRDNADLPAWMKDTDYEWTPRRFTRAALVAVPQVALI